jgi:peptidoglycan hydrolase-like protein with peptidoglycan-binding domain
MTPLAKDTENFIWIPSSEPRRYGGAFAALSVVVLAIVCGCVIGNAPLRGFVDAFNRKGIDAELSAAGERQMMAEPTRVDRSHGNRARVEHREATDPALMLSSHRKMGMPAKRRRALMRWLQAKVGVQADGAFGASTENALKAWQDKNGLAADGIVGPDTLMVMGFCDLVLLKRGAHGDIVKRLQAELAIGADGQFGPRTEKAVRDYQKKNGLVADGVAGLAMLAQMKLLKKGTADSSASSVVGAAQGPSLRACRYDIRSDRQRTGKY